MFRSTSAGDFELVTQDNISEHCVVGGKNEQRECYEYHIEFLKEKKQITLAHI